MSGPLPASGYLSNISRLTSDMQTALELINSVIKEMIGGASENATLTIASNSITPLNNACVIPVDATGGGTIDTINVSNMRDGQVIFLHSVNSANPITIANLASGSGVPIATFSGQNIVLTNTAMFISLKYNQSLNLLQEIFPYPNWGAPGAIGATTANTGAFTSMSLTTPLALSYGGTGVTNATQLTGLINAFTSSLSGAAPASGGGTSNFLRADGSWAVPAGGGGGAVSSVSNSDGTVTVSPTTGAVVVSLPATAVSAGSYTSADITVDSYGRITAASNGSGGGSASNYYGTGADGAQTYTTNTTVGNSTADSVFLISNFSSLTVNSGVIVTAAARKRAWLIYVTGDCTINGTLTMSALGANSAASVIDLYKYSQVSQTFSTEISNQTVNIPQTNYSTPAVGANGGATQSTGASGNAGSAGAGGGTGGGGSGGGSSGGGSTIGSGGAGAAGTSYSGGSGGGGGSTTGTGTNGSAGSANGGAGGNAGSSTGGGSNAGGGAGNPGGTGTTGSSGGVGSNGLAGTGGIIIIVCGGNLTIGSGAVISANGAAGGQAINSTHIGAGGGGSGGGAVICLYSSSGTLSNAGSLTATGGAGGVASGNSSANWSGGAGGAGSVIGPTQIL